MVATEPWHQPAAVALVRELAFFFLNSDPDFFLTKEVGDGISF